MSYSEYKYDNYTVEDWVIDDDFISYVNGSSNTTISVLEESLRHSSNLKQAKVLISGLSKTAPNVPQDKLDQIFASINATLDAKTSATNPSPLKLHKWKWLGAVAAAVALVIVFLPQIFNDSEVVATEIAHTETVTLPDNSIVELNNSSEVKFLGKKWDRKVHLKGEAFFKVEKGSKFTVASSQGRVSVLGTQFNIYDRDGLYEVECIEGRVQVDMKDGSTHILNAGDKLADFNKSRSPVVRNAVVTEIDWLQNFVQIDSMELGFVFDELQRYYDIEFLNEKAIREKRYEGFFATNSLDSAIYQILWPLGIDYSIKDNRVIIK